MQSRPLFSIITVALNCADDAEYTARSVLAQDYPQVEYLVQDGGSTDGTVERLTSLGVTGIVSAPDNGIYDAMNRAIARSSGAYICFMNAGDRFVATDTLSKVATVIARSKQPDFLYGDMRSLIQHPYLHLEAQPSAGREISYPNRLSRFWLFRKMVCHQTWFVRRELYSALGGLDTQYRLLADYAFILRAFADRRRRFVHVPVVVAEFQGGGASESHERLHAEERRAIQAWAYSPIERAVYGAAYYGARSLARDLVYRTIYPLLPSAARRRLNGW